jgi:hypothetical protein
MDITSDRQRCDNLESAAAVRAGRQRASDGRGTFPHPDNAVTLSPR